MPPAQKSPARLSPLVRAEIAAMIAASLRARALRRSRVPRRRLPVVSSRPALSVWSPLPRSPRSRPPRLAVWSLADGVESLLGALCRFLGV